MVPFRPYYEQHFRALGPQHLENLYAKFEVAKVDPEPRSVWCLVGACWGLVTAMQPVSAMGAREQDLRTSNALP
eukprot:s8097_g1.t1